MPHTRYLVIVGATNVSLYKDKGRRFHSKRRAQRRAQTLQRQGYPTRVVTVHPR